MAGIGETLRDERLRRSLDLEQISQELRISTRFLKAIESEQFGKLPGGIFTKSFVRQYARLLGLDEEKIAAEVDRFLDPRPDFTAAQESPRLVVAGIHVPPMEAWARVGGGSRLSWRSILPPMALIALIMLLCSGAYVLWQKARHPAARAVQSNAVAARAPVPSPQPPPQLPAALPNSTEGGTGAPVSPLPANAPAAAPGPQGAPYAGSGVAGAPARVHVEVTAREPVWVSARGDGKFLFSTTLEANQSRTAEAGETVELRLDNAGAVDILVNGKSIGPVGPKGQVRTIQIGSGGFTVVSPNPVVPPAAR